MLLLDILNTVVKTTVFNASKAYFILPREKKKTASNPLFGQKCKFQLISLLSGVDFIRSELIIEFHVP